MYKVIRVFKTGTADTEEKPIGSLVDGFRTDTLSYIVARIQFG